MNRLVSEKEALLTAFPYSLSREERLKKLADVIAGKLIKVVGETACVSVFPNVDELPEEVLDILAVDLKIQWYEIDAPISSKRQTVKECIRIHKYKGTKYAVETALRGIYEDVRVLEWNEYGGEPYHFKVVIYDSSNDREKRDRVLQKVDYYKNARSVLEETIFEVGVSTDVPIKTAIRPCGMIKRIRSEVKNYG